MSAWSQDQITGLREGCEKHLPFSEIAKIIGKTRNACIGQAHRLGYSTGNKPCGNGHANGEKSASPKKKKKSRGVTPFNAQSSKRSKPIDPTPHVEDANDAPINPVTLVELEDHHCRWPYGDPKEPGFHFCGANRVTLDVKGKPRLLPYCARHARKAYDGGGA